MWSSKLGLGGGGDRGWRLGIGARDVLWIFRNGNGNGVAVDYYLVNRRVNDVTNYIKFFGRTHPLRSRVTSSLACLTRPRDQPLPYSPPRGSSLE